MESLQEIIESGFKQLSTLTPNTTSKEIRGAVEDTINHLNQGRLRVASYDNQQWVTHEWLKKAILLSFKIN